MTVLVGGVGQLYQGDLDVGRHVVRALAGVDLGPQVLVEDLDYGAVAVVQRLEDLRPSTLVLVGAAARGRPPGTVELRPVRGVDATADELQDAVRQAVTGYVTIDLVLHVAAALDALPARSVTVEVEPVLVGPHEQLSSAVAGRVQELARLAAQEAREAAASRSAPTGRPSS